MRSNKDEILAICMGIGISNNRTGDNAYLDPLCWKLPDCEYKKCYVHRSDSLVFCNEGSWSFRASSVEVFGFNGN